MHRRPTKLDAGRTKAAHFQSRYSYISSRIHPGTEHQCVYLAGADCHTAYLQAIERADGRCSKCGRWGHVEVDHIEHKTKMSRCWCDENLQALCVGRHRGARGKHVQIRSAKTQQETHDLIEVENA